MTSRSLNTGFSIGVTNEDASDIPSQAQAEATPTVSNATPEAFSAGVSLLERPDSPLKLPTASYQ